MAPPSFLPKVRVLAIAHARAHGVDDPKLVDQFIAEINGAWRTLVVRIRQAERDRTAASKIARGRAVAAACDVLGMDLPRRGRPIDMRLAKRKKRALVRAYHPDANGGSEASSGKIQDVISAYETLAHYARMEATSG